MLNGAYETLELEELEDFEDGELEDWESEDLYEDWEGDPFLGDVFKRLASSAARAAGSAIAGRRGADIASMVANRVLREGEFESDYESEADFEYEFEAEGGDLGILDEMQYYAELAAEAESEAEADQFLGVIASLAGPLISSFMREAEYGDYEDEADPFLGSIVSAASSLLPRAVPLIKRGVQMVGRFLRRPGTRRAIRSIPRIVAGTATSLMRQARAGRRLTPAGVAATMARQTASTLASRRRMAQAVRRNRAAASRFRRQRPARGRMLRRRRRIVRPRYCVY